ncbi:VIT family protein [Sphingomonas sp. MA1305]|jgi:VIT1/CCC1 family predicted Fe2+/Mn2+ transporter|nr:VIT family protein [Sphingomonas sp. MA1305]MCP4025500.1 VIT family protein [Sphingomonas sp.]
MRLNSFPASEAHYMTRIGWLRAAVLGANDGLLSTSSVIVGVAAATPGGRQVLISGIAALVAGAMSMAAGEYVSVSSQSDTETADLTRERRELLENPEAEQRELAAIYVGRGLTVELADEVARQLMASDALAAHARDELSITEVSSARPVQAALASAVSFAAGGLWPVLSVLIAPAKSVVPVVAMTALLALAVLGAVGARAGGAPPLRALIRVVVWGVLAMAITFGVGRFFGTSAG